MIVFSNMHFVIRFRFQKSKRSEEREVSLLFYYQPNQKSRTLGPLLKENHVQIVLPKEISHEKVQKFSRVFARLSQKNSNA